MSVPKTMKALVVEVSKRAVVKDVPVPALKPREVLIKVAYAASNPTDYKHLELQSPPGAILGCDYSGTVVSAGPGVTTLSIGDRVGGVVHGGKYGDKGSYAEYAKQEEEFVWRLPENMEMGGAATYGVGYVTAAMSLFHHHGNPFPPAQRSSPGWFFIQGGSTSVGLFAIQLARLIGYRVTTTCSPHSFDLVRSYGADHVVDYHRPDEAVEEIKRVTADGVVAGLECVGGLENMSLAIKALGAKGGLLTTLAVVPEEAHGIREEVKVGRILMYTVFGHSFVFLLDKPALPASPEDRAWFAQLVKITPDLMTKYGVRPNPVDLREGLDKVPNGLGELKSAKVSGRKLVYKIGPGKQTS